jgi:hypothetical protein
MSSWSPRMAEPGIVRLSLRLTGLLGLLLFLSPATASATSDFADIACLSSSNCVAVGGSDAIGTSQTQVATWNGTAWARQTTPVPEGASRSSLSGLACPATTNCIAVGSTVDLENVKHALAMTWNGATWTIAPVPEPAGAKSSWLTDIVCTSATVCKAVGTYVNSSGVRQTLITNLSGSSWALVASPNMSGSKSNDLGSISCSSASACYAVGNYTDSTGVTKPLAIGWNGTSWSISVVPAPSGATYSSLSGVACLTNNCKAVGTYFNSIGVQKSFASQWLGSSWTAMAPPEPSGADTSQLRAISCVSTSVCSAVGTYHKGQDDLPHALWWNGTSWSLQTVDISSVGAVGSDLTAISCLSATFCHASGSIVYGHVAANRNLAFKYDGSAWLLTESGGYERTWSDMSPGQSSAANRMEMSCVSISWCVRVGTYQRGKDVERAFVQRWSGAAWYPQSLPIPAGARSTALEGVACRSSTDCTAVGVYVDLTGSERSLSFSWNGTAWASLTTPVPGGSLASHLSGVSCVPGSCTAVGRFVDSGGVKSALAMSWNGTTWSIASTPAVSGATGVSLQDVSCTSTTLCKAVGIYEGAGTTHGFALYWNGSAWTVATLPAEPTGAIGSALTDISCIAATFCSTVGTYRDASDVVHGLNLRWTSGTSWSTISVPSPDESRWTKLFDVHCTSAAACVAVGESGDEAGHRQGFVINGTGTAWTKHPAIEPEKTAEWSLRSVVCISGSGCMAIGDHLDKWATNRIISLGWAGQKWTAGPSPEPKGASSSELLDVSCLGSASCVAVGKSTLSGAVGSFAATGNPGEWTVTSTPTPAGASASELVDVDCSTTVSCTAVGSFILSGAKKPLAMKWNGTSWSILTTPVPVGATSSELTGLECLSPNSCTAVGTYTVSGTKKTLAMSWNGSSWSVVTTPTPSGATSSELTAVSCTATTFCMASGTYTSSGRKNLAMKWNGTAWSVVATPNYAESLESVLNGIACTSTSWCSAVGYYRSSSSDETSAMTWNGTTWTLVSSPSDGFSDQLRDVTCASSAACTAVGISDANIGLPIGLVHTWDGSKWTMSAVDGLGSPNAGPLQGISCGTIGISTSPCVGVGNFSDEKWQKRTLTEHWDPVVGTKGAMSALMGVTCLATGCVAVGKIDSEPGVDQTEVAWRLEDSGWTALSMPSVPGGLLRDVSCTSLTSCTAVGRQGSGTLAERWDGTQWSVQTTPNPTGTGHTLGGVACPTSVNCTTVGYYVSGSHRSVLIEAWNGTAWSTQTAPLPAGATDGWLEDIVCVGVSSCMAVGSYEDANGVEHPLSERWNGTSWAVATVPDAPTSTGTELMGVDCRSSSNCMAVGNYTVSSASHPFSVSWNGTSWNQLTMPSAETAKQSFLSDVSCFGSGRCVAVGYAIPKALPGYATLAMSWNGTGWYIEPTPNRDNSLEAPQGSLDGISCPAAADCTAVGTSSDLNVESELALGTPDISATPESGEEALELSEAAPKLSEQQVEDAQSLIAADPAFQAAVQGDNYALTVGPWTETSPSKETVLTGVSATVAMVTPHDWAERVWPLIEYDLEQPDSYSEGTYLDAETKASATEVTTLIVQLDAETDVNGNLIDGEVVMIEPVGDEAAEVTYVPEALKEFELDPNGWEY